MPLHLAVTLPRLAARASATVRFQHSFRDLFENRWSGTRYQRRPLDGLAHFDSRRDEIEAILRRDGNETPL